MKRLAGLAALAFVLGGTGLVKADYGTGFEGANPLDGWTLTGTPVINTDPAFVHSGSQSLQLDAGVRAVIAFAASEEFGKLSMWVFDKGNVMSDTTKTATANGPSWGAVDGSNRVFQEMLWNRSFASDTDIHYHFTASDTGNSRFSGWGGGNRILNGWNFFEFDRPDGTTLTLTVNGGTPHVVTPLEKGFEAATETDPEVPGNWGHGEGFKSISLWGGNTDTNSAQLGGIYVDDISFVAVPVPEPASLTLLGLGAGALLVRRRRA